jgi:hypothetical protein
MDCKVKGKIEREYDKFTHCIYGVPVLQYNRTVGTQRESGTREWKDRDKRGTSVEGKTAIQWEDVMWSEIKVTKSMSVG